MDGRNAPVNNIWHSSFVYKANIIYSEHYSYIDPLSILAKIYYAYIYNIFKQLYTYNVRNNY